MALLSQLLGNRELAWEDQLEQGRIWIYGDGNEYTFLCNGFCWKPPGCGIAVIEVFGAGGSSGRGCCCGFALPSNPGAYARKTICVCPDNFVCQQQGQGGRACGDTPGHGRGCPTPTCVCWQGCAKYPLYNGGENERDQISTSSWKGNNPWGWGNGETIGNIASRASTNKYRVPRGSDNGSICCEAGASAGFMCAQGGFSGYFQCMNDARPYACWQRTKWCTRMIHGGECVHFCGLICNVCSDFSNQFDKRGIRCAFGGDMNCCATFSCTRSMQCVPNNPSCNHQYYQQTPPMRYSTEGGVFTYPMDHDSPAAPVSGGAVWAMLQGINTLTRDPSHSTLAWCWNGSRACGCYESFGCVAWSPSGMGGYPAVVCGNVRDHGGRGGMGTVRIRYIPTDGGDTY